MEKDTTMTIIIFTINGINSLLGWNAVLAALDFFQSRFTEYNIYSFLPVPLFAGYLLVGATYHELSNKFKYSTLIICGNTGITLSLLMILIVSLTLDQTITGFILLQFSSFLIGVFANSSQLTFFAMINYLSQEVVSKFTVGTAVSGLLITAIRAIILAIAGDNNDSTAPIIIYFVIAIAFNTIDMIINIRFCKSSVYKHKIDRFLLHTDLNPLEAIEKEVSNRDSLNPTQQQDDKQEPVGQKYVKQEERIQNQSYFRTMYETFFKIFPYPLIILLTFVVTFTLFPGPSLKKSFGDKISGAWSSVLFLLAYNLGDTVGKYIVQFKGVFNPKSLIFIFFSRLYFFFTITIMANGQDEDDQLINNVVFPFFNQFLFAFTNGFCINASFIMAFKICPLQYKKYAGVFCGLILQFGIMVGTVFQIPYSYIIGIN